MDYKTWYDAAKAELQTVQGEKAELHRALADRDQQIAALIQTINAIAPLVGEQTVSAPSGDESDAPPAGMTNCIRVILKEAKHPLSAGEVRDRLGDMGVAIQDYSNPLATIHTILRRLTDSGEVEADYEMNAPSSGPKKFSVAAGKGYRIEKVAGKSFEIGKMKGFIGVGRLKRDRKSLPNPRP